MRAAHSMPGLAASAPPAATALSGLHPAGPPAHLLRGEALLRHPLEQGHGCGAAALLAGVAAQVQLGQVVGGQQGAVGGGGGGVKRGLGQEMQGGGRAVSRAPLERREAASKMAWGKEEAGGARA